MAIGVITSSPRVGFKGRVGRLPSLSTKASHALKEVQFRSLPELPDHGLPLKFRRVWGEDVELEDRLNVARVGLCNVRHNFQGCIPDADVCNMMPHVKHEDRQPDERLYITRQPEDKPCTSRRRVSKEPSFQVFPIIDPLRKTSDVLPRVPVQAQSGTGQYVLTDLTRKALADCAARFYRTSRNSQIYVDHSNHLKLRTERDAQFIKECPKAVTLGRYRQTAHLDHPGPYPMRTAEGFNLELDARNKSQENVESCDATAVPKKFVKYVKCQDCGNTIDIVQADEQGDKSQENIGGICLCEVCASQRLAMPRLRHHCRDGIILDQKKNMNDGAVLDKEAENETEFDTTMEYFGPWLDASNIQYCDVSEEDEASLTPPSYCFRHPSFIHCRLAQNEDITPVLGQGRRVSVLPADIYPEYFQSGNEGNENYTPAKNLPNKWTFRDKHNLRRPCMSKVVGTLNKSDANKRFHSKHPELVPDLRDNRRTHRRVNFYGYHSCVYR